MVSLSGSSWNSFEAEELRELVIGMTGGGVCRGADEGREG